jgi:DnaJ-class molecular chaperone
MTRQEAIDISDQIYQLTQQLRKDFACEECKGIGVINPEWYGWHPCEACYGEGWIIPNEDEEE